MNTLKKSSLFIRTALLTGIILLAYNRPDLANETKALTPDYLVSGSWGPENILGMKITFTRDGNFESSVNYGQSGTDASGTYTLDSGKLSLTVKSASPDNSITGLILKNGMLVHDASSPKYRYYISFKGEELEQLYIKGGELKIWDYNSLVKEGSPLKINGEEAVAMGAKNAVTTAVLKMRVAPSPDAKEVHYTYADIDQTYTVKALPVNTSLIVLARTKDKKKVGKLTNYWYYVEFERYFDYMRAWVYGEFVQIKN